MTEAEHSRDLERQHEQFLKTLQDQSIKTYKDLEKYKAELRSKR